MQVTACTNPAPIQLASNLAAALEATIQCTIPGSAVETIFVGYLLANMGGG